MSISLSAERSDEGCRAFLEKAWKKFTTLSIHESYSLHSQQCGLVTHPIHHGFEVELAKWTRNESRMGTQWPRRFRTFVFLITSSVCKLGQFCSAIAVTQCSNVRPTLISRSEGGCLCFNDVSLFNLIPTLIVCPKQTMKFGDVTIRLDSVRVCFTISGIRLGQHKRTWHSRRETGSKQTSFDFSLRKLLLKRRYVTNWRSGNLTARWSLTHFTYNSS